MKKDDSFVSRRVFVLGFAITSATVAGCGEAPVAPATPFQPSAVFNNSLYDNLRSIRVSKVDDPRNIIIDVCRIKNFKKKDKGHAEFHDADIEGRMLDDRWKKAKDLQYKVFGEVGARNGDPFSIVSRHHLPLIIVTDDTVVWQNEKDKKFTVTVSTNNQVCDAVSSPVTDIFGWGSNTKNSAPDNGDGKIEKVYGKVALTDPIKSQRFYKFSVTFINDNTIDPLDPDVICGEP